MTPPDPRGPDHPGGPESDRDAAADQTAVDQTSLVDLTAVAPVDLPLTLARLHRDLPPDAVVGLRLPDLDGEAAALGLHRLLVGGGWQPVPHRADVDDQPERALDPRSALGLGSDGQAVVVERTWTLPDTVGPAMAALVCGLNPSPTAADTGVGYRGPGNRFWPLATEVGLVTVGPDPHRALAVDRVGFTDLVKRTTVGADELRPQEYRDGFARIEALCSWLQPAVVVLVGLHGWRIAVDRRARPGWQERGVGGCRTLLMASTSGRNAGTPTAQLRAALAEVTAEVSPHRR